MEFPSLLGIYLSVFDAIRQPNDVHVYAAENKNDLELPQKKMCRHYFYPNYLFCDSDDIRYKSYNLNYFENINEINKKKWKFIGQRCSENIVGKIEKFKELSGLVASRKHPVFYSIEDSLNKESVYVFLRNGTLVGCIISIKI